MKNDECSSTESTVEANPEKPERLTFGKMRFASAKDRARLAESTDNKSGS